MLKNKKKIAMFFIIVSLLFFPFWIVKADSGWDSSYGGGSGSSGGSYSGGYSSSYDSSYYSSSHDYGSSDGEFDLMEFAIMIFLFIFFIILFYELSKNPKGMYDKTPSNISYQDINEEKLRSILSSETVDSLKKMAYQKFVEIQNAWMNFDYETLRELCTDELYNSYKSQLEVLKLKNGQNIMNSFELLNTSIYDVIENNGEVTVKVYMMIKFYDYVIDTNSKKVIRGTKDTKICNNYLMEFVRKQNIDDKEVYCPNCGASIKNNTSGECEYCGSTIVKSANDYVLSKKTNINK